LHTEIPFEKGGETRIDDLENKANNSINQEAFQRFHRYSMVLANLEHASSGKEHYGNATRIERFKFFGNGYIMYKEER